MKKNITIKQNNIEITASCIYSNRKTIGIEIKEDLSVMIRVPNKTKEETIRNIIENKKTWIIEKYQTIKQNSEKNGIKTIEQIYIHENYLPFLGENRIQLILILPKEETEKKVIWKEEKVSFKERKLMVQVDAANIEAIRLCVVAYYKERARAYLQERVAYYSRIMRVTYKKITIREQKTCWGSCSSKKNLNFNWKLILMPKEILDYVVVHELAHLKYMNHSQDFWKEIESVLSDYKQKDKWLDEHGKEYSQY